MSESSLQVNNLKGIYPALVTPFVDEPGLKPAVDFESYKALVEWQLEACLLYTSPSPRDATLSRMPSSA